MILGAVEMDPQKRDPTIIGFGRIDHRKHAQAPDHSRLPPTIALLNRTQNRPPPIGI
jgi:hypothetical protein